MCAMLVTGTRAVIGVDVGASMRSNVTVGPLRSPITANVRWAISDALSGRRLPTRTDASADEVGARRTVNRFSNEPATRPTSEESRASTPTTETTGFTALFDVIAGSTSAATAIAIANVRSTRRHTRSLT